MDNSTDNFIEELNINVYRNIVKFTLESMKEISEKEPEYNLQYDIIRYYEDTIKREGKITQQEFLQICNDVGIK